MRVAHADRHRIARQRQVQQCPPRAPAARRPVQLWLPHVHAEPAIGTPHAPANRRARCSSVTASRARLGHHEIGNAAGGIAAGACPAAVAVPEIQREIRAVRIADFGQLVKARRRGAGRQAPAPAQPSSPARAPARIDDHEIIAQPRAFS